MRAMLFMLFLGCVSTGCVMDDPYVYDAPYCGSGHTYYSTPISGPSGVMPANYTPPQTQEPELLPARR